MSTLTVPQSGLVAAVGSTVVRMDPGTIPFTQAASFMRYTSGGELNVMANLARTFRVPQVSMFTALPEGDPNADFVEQGIRGAGVTPVFRRFESDQVNGPKIAVVWSDQGFGGRKPVVKYDRANEAGKLLKPGDFDWTEHFRAGQTRLVHSGGIFASLSKNTAALVVEAFRAAKAAGAVTSFDLNYRAKLITAHGLESTIVDVLREIVSLTDVLVGNEEDLQKGLGIEGQEVTNAHSKLDPEGFKTMISTVRGMFPNLSVVATSLRDVKTTNLHGWSGIMCHDGLFYQAPVGDIQVLDRVGGGDAFASGLLYGLMQGMDPQDVINLARAAGACKVTYPGDWLMGSLADVEVFLAGKKPRVER